MAWLKDLEQVFAVDSVKIGSLEEVGEVCEKKAARYSLTEIFAINLGMIFDD